ncbi:lactate racemase domain-containing protein [Halobaculum gomorrense]|uniref:Nickel-dependent lactate racemase n=1 Tax=Halobaculum gomorrense TaxID=43928 RepID=A0A1M5U4F0_9EURY|nr:lactate racemase domain-containing protein [Halobaculum gomorrense]SHH57563.1 Nickel-dependent lactate racemase [Halobaculum gomorrense]
MADQEFSLPLGDGSIAVSLPDCEVDVAVPPGGEAVDPRAAAEAALDDPHGPPLREVVDPEDEVCVVVTDVTRATPDEALVGAMLDRLPVSRDGVTVVLGLGLHRPMTDAEVESGLGAFADLAANHDPDAAVEVGSVDGVPVEVNPAVAEADAVLSTGMVEPHQYAGFSGGAKTVVVGAGGEPLIRHTHGPELLAEFGVRLGRVADNPFRAFLDRAGDVAGPEFCVNVTHGPAGILDAAAGEPRAVVRDLADTARGALSVEVAGGYDAVLAGVGAPKDANLYQASRAATYVILGASNPLRGDGRVVVPARLHEGAGDGRGERRFRDRLAAGESAAAVYEEMREGYEPGAQRAFVLARALRDHEVWITNSAHPALVEECLMHAAASPVEAIEPGSRVLVVPDALNTLLV